MFAGDRAVSRCARGAGYTVASMDIAYWNAWHAKKSKEKAENTRKKISSNPLDLLSASGFAIPSCIWYVCNLQCEKLHHPCDASTSPFFSEDSTLGSSTGAPWAIGRSIGYSLCQFCIHMPSYNPTVVSEPDGLCCSLGGSVWEFIGIKAWPSIQASLQLDIKTMV